MSAPLHLALYFSGLSGGGAQRRMLALASGFVARGHSVDVVVAGADGPFRTAVPRAARIVDLQGPVARSAPIRDRRGLRVLCTTARLGRYLQAERPDVLLSTSNAANVAALVAGAAASVPVVVSINVHLGAATASRGRLSRFLLHAALRRVYAKADRVVAVSAGVASDLGARFGIDDGRLHVIANPVDVAAIARSAGAGVDHDWTRPGSPPLVLAVGKLSPQKDFPTLLRAFARVRQSRDANLVILGEGAERPRLEAIVRALGIAGSVEMPGFVVNPYAWMARASVFVLSSAWEGFSNALAEAMACGCPVVSTDCPSGPAELLEGGRLAPLVEPGDADAMASAILGVLAGDPDRDALRARAEAFGVNAATDRYLAVLGEAAGAAWRRRAPGRGLTPATEENR